MVPIARQYSNTRYKHPDSQTQCNRCDPHNMHHRPLVINLTMGAARTTGRLAAAGTIGPPVAPLRTSLCHRVFARLDLAQFERGTVVPIGELRDESRSGQEGERRKTANRRGLPKMWVFLIRGRRASRWKTSAEPVTCKATYRTPVSGPEGPGEECPPTVPDDEPA